MAARSSGLRPSFVMLALTASSTSAYLPVTESTGKLLPKRQRPGPNAAIVTSIHGCNESAVQAPASVCM
eukprot:UC1_evm1s1007